MVFAFSNQPRNTVCNFFRFLLVLKPLFLLFCSCMLLFPLGIFLGFLGIGFFMKSLFKQFACFLFIFSISFGVGTTYTPITIVHGLPNSFFEPPCVADTQHEDEPDALWQRYVRANLFAVEPHGGYGLAVQGSIQRDDEVNRVYGKIYIPLGITEKRYFDSDHYSRGSTIADLTVQIGITAIQRRSFELEAYALGKIPMATYKHSCWPQDNNVSGGFGSSCFIRMCGTPQHHFDCLTEADILFNTKWASYKIQSALVYRFGNFISDLGWRYIHRDYACFLSLFSDIGWLMHSDHTSSYILVGLGAITAAGRWGNAGVMPVSQIKFGVNF